MIAITPFPKFDGKQESWAEVRRLFKELMKETRQGEALYMANLTDKLPAEANRIRAGITDPKEA